jgi:hypothetical protein
VNGIAAEINCYGDKWLQQPHPDIASQSSVRNQEIALRRLALSHWHQAERRTYYKQLSVAERNDLAATTFGRFVQAAGRLVRGGVPVQIRFIDAAWAPESARYLCPSLKHRRLDTVYTSLLVAMICRLKVYTAANDPIGQLLYAPFAGLDDIDGLRFRVNKCEE